uniref:hypothetical protein n=1 Tax=Mycobacterium tuberculosis TaxID=1773 RepID=UPI00254F7959
DTVRQLATGQPGVAEEQHRLTAWHALDPEIVYSRLAGGSRPLADELAARPISILCANAGPVPVMGGRTALPSPATMRSAQRTE